MDPLLQHIPPRSPRRPRPAADSYRALRSFRWHTEAHNLADMTLRAYIDLQDEQEEVLVNAATDVLNHVVLEVRNLIEMEMLRDLKIRKGWEGIWLRDGIPAVESLAIRWLAHANGINEVLPPEEPAGN